LDLVTEEASVEEAKSVLNSMIISYLEVAINTNEVESIPALLLRKGPWYDRLAFNVLAWWNHRNTRPRRRFTFNQFIPMHPGVACR
jgi:hypothetical protein